MKIKFKLFFADQYSLEKEINAWLESFNTVVTILHSNTAEICVSDNGALTICHLIYYIEN